MSAHYFIFLSDPMLKFKNVCKPITKKLKCKKTTLQTLSLNFDNT